MLETLLYVDKNVSLIEFVHKTHKNSYLIS